MKLCITPNRQWKRVLGWMTKPFHTTALTRAELADERELLRTVIDNLPDMVYIKDRQGRFVLNNTASLRFHRGQRQEDMSGKTDFDFHPRHQAEQYYATEQHIIQSGEPHLNLEEEYVTPMGEKRWMSTNKFPLQNAVGDIIGLMGIAHDITERKQAEQQLIGSEERYRIVSELMSDYAYAMKINEAGELIPDWMTEEAFLRVTGYDYGSISSTSYVLFDPEDVQRVSAHVQRVRQGETVEAEYQIITKSGERRWLRILRRPIWDANHERVTGFYGVAQDITERKLAEQRLAESEERYRITTELMSDYAYSYSVESDGKIIPEWTTEEAFQRLTGYDDEELRLAIYKLYHPDDVEAVQRDIESVIQGEAVSGIYRIITKSGEVRWLEIFRRPVWDEHQSRVVRFYGVARDITERKLAEQRLAESEERYRAVSELMSDYAYAYQVNPDGSITHEWTTEEAFQRVTGYEYGEAIWSTTYRLYHPDDILAVQQDLKQVIGGKTVAGEYRIVTKSGEIRWVEVFRRPVWDAQQGQVVRFYGVVRDITERKLAEQRLAESEERYRTVSELMSDYAYAYRVEADGSIFPEWATEEAFTRLTGFDYRELTWSTFRLYHPDDAAAVQQDIEQVIQNKAAAGEYRIVTKSGEIRWLEIFRRPVWDEQQGRVVRFYGVARDITERKLAEQRLGESEERHRAVSELMSDFAYATRIEAGGSLTNEWVTDAFTRIIGYTREEFVRASGWSQLVHADDEPHVADHIKQLLAGQDSVVEFRMVAKDGDIHWVRDYSRPVWSDTEKRVIRFYGAVKDITDQKRTEEQLSFQADILAQVMDTVVVSDHRGIIRYWNDAAERMYGYSAEEAVGQTVPETTNYRFANPEDEGKMTEALQRVGNWRGEFVAKTKQGDEIFIESSIKALKNKKGDLEGSIAVIRNITRRKAMENSEREQRLLAEALRDTASAISSSLDLNEVLDRILVELSKVLPRDAANVSLLENDMIRVARYSHEYSDLGVEDFTKTLTVFIKNAPLATQMLQEGQPILITDTANDPRWYTMPGSWVRSYLSAPIRFGSEVIGFLNLDGGTPGMFTEEHARRLKAFADLAGAAIQNARLFEAISQYALEMEERVTERTAELEMQRKQLQTILDATGEGIYYIEDTNIQYANAAMLRLFKCKDAAELIGQRTSILQPPDPPQESETRLTSISALRKGGVWRGEAKLMRRDGEIFDAGLTIALLSGVGEKPIRAVTVVRDISQEIQLKEQKTRFIEHASHELRTPITNIITRLYLAKNQPEKLSEHITVMENVSKRMKTLVDDLLDAGRFERGLIPLKQEPILLQELLKDVVEVQQAEAANKQIELMSQLPDQPIYVFGDRNRIIQVVTNLVTNAINYTPAEGRVTVGLEFDENTQQASIHVTDTGMGIPEEHMPFIFQPFYRIDQKIKGTGLGLSITREIVELHGGQINVQSKTGEGSRFTVTLAMIKQAE